MSIPLRSDFGSRNAKAQSLISATSSPRFFFRYSSGCHESYAANDARPERFHADADVHESHAAADDGAGWYVPHDDATAAAYATTAWNGRMSTSWHAASAW